MFVAVAAFSFELVFELVVGFVSTASSSASAVSSIAFASTFTTFIALAVFLLSTCANCVTCLVAARALVVSAVLSHLTRGDSILNVKLRMFGKASRDVNVFEEFESESTH
jgi:hypothetical protein